MRVVFAAAVISAAFVCVDAEAASVLTFSGGTYSQGADGLSLNYTEGNFFVAPDPSTGWLVDGGHIHHGYASAANTISLIDGSGFNVHSIDLSPHRNGYRWQDPATGSTQPCGTVCQDVSLVGYRDDVAVASAITSSAVNGTFLLDASFADITSLVVSIRNFNSDPAFLAMSAQGFGFDYEESHFSYGNVVISAVPLPAGMPLMGVALLALGGLARRQRRKAKDRRMILP
ncbi:MAG: VPLPA-CTERM sorting domain-containing protein [Marinibacterium sp.]